MKIVETHISNIKHGDTVLHEGVIQTVSNSNIKTNGFMGTSIFGDSYKLGSVLVKKVIYPQLILST